MIGFEGRVDDAAMGPVTHLASRLCDQAQGGQLLISQRVFVAGEELVHANPWENSRSLEWQIPEGRETGWHVVIGDNG